jgi:hypothetical protein
LQNTRSDKNLDNLSRSIANQSEGRAGKSLPAVPVLQNQLKDDEQEGALQLKQVPVQKISANVIQRVAQQVVVTGITHLVQANKGSIQEGDEVGEVSDGQVIEIDTAQKLRSRRGPNQEVYKLFDKDSEPHFRWFKVLKVGEKDAPPNTYIRDETFHIEDVAMLGNRPSRIKGHGRDRVTPETAEIHQLAEQIISNSANVPSAGEVLGIVNGFYGKHKPMHDPMKTIRLMQIAYSLSVNPQIRLLLQSAAGILKVKRMLEFLREITGRQFIQDWSGNPAQDVVGRALAWEAFVTGVNALKGDRKKLGGYLDHSVEHDKGYGQTLESAQEYFLYEMEEAGGFAGGAAAAEAIDFGAHIISCFKHDLNGNIWDGGMLESGPVAQQLKRAKPTKTMGTMANDVQEDKMWERVVFVLIPASITGVKDWSFAPNLRENIDTIYNAVRALVPNTFVLHKSMLGDAIGGVGG